MKRVAKKWYWIAGSCFALLFTILLFIRLDIFSSVIPRLPWHKTSPAAKTARNEEQWVAIMQAKHKIGYVHRTFKTTEKGYRLDEAILMRINTMGVVQDMRMKTESDLHADLTLSTFSFDLQSQIFRFVARGAVKGGEAVIDYGTPTALRKLVLPLQEAPMLSNSMYEVLRGKTLKEGDELVINVFDPASMGQRPVSIKVMGQEPVFIMGRQRMARKLDVDFMGARQYAWLGEEGDVLKEEGMLGMTMERVSREQALDGLTLSASSDLTEAASIAANKVIADPERLTTMTVRLKDIKTAPLHLDGDRQSFREGRLTIRKEAWPIASTKRPYPSDIDKFIQASPFIQSDDPQIRNQVRKIISPRDSDMVKAKKIVEWLYRNIEKRPVISVPNASETLENRIGDCNEHAALLAAMARAAGIPAQIEVGLVYQRGRFYYHAWNVLYLGHWITADAVLGTMPANVTHIRLSRGMQERQLDLIGIIGKLKLEILSMS